MLLHERHRRPRSAARPTTATPVKGRTPSPSSCRPCWFSRHAGIRSMPDAGRGIGWRCREAGFRRRGIECHVLRRHRTGETGERRPCRDHGRADKPLNGRRKRKSGPPREDPDEIPDRACDPPGRQALRRRAATSAATPVRPSHTPAGSGTGEGVRFRVPDRDHRGHKTRIVGEVVVQHAQEQLSGCSQRPRRRKSPPRSRARTIRSVPSTSRTGPSLSPAISPSRRGSSHLARSGRPS